MEPHFQTAAKQKEEEGDRQQYLWSPGKNEEKALCPRGDPFDGRMQSEQATELLHAVMTLSGWEGARFPMLAGRTIEGTLE